MDGPDTPGLSVSANDTRWQRSRGKECVLEERDSEKNTKTKCNSLLLFNWADGFWRHNTRSDKETDELNLYANLDKNLAERSESVWRPGVYPLLRCFLCSRAWFIGCGWKRSISMWVDTSIFSVTWQKDTKKELMAAQGKTNQLVVIVKKMSWMTEKRG